MRMTEKSQNKRKYNKSDSLILQEEEGEKMSVITITLVHGKSKEFRSGIVTHQNDYFQVGRNAI